MHRIPVEHNPGHHHNMEDVMAPTHPIKAPRHPLLGHLQRIHRRAKQIHRNALHDRRIEKQRPPDTALNKQLRHWEGTGGAEGEVEDHAPHSHICAVEDGLPGEDNAGDAEDAGDGHVEGSGEGLVVEGGVFGGHDGDGDEEGDAGVVDAGEAFHEGLLADAGEGVPDCGTGQRLSCREEEQPVDNLIRRRVELPDLTRRICPKRECEDQQKPEPMAPDVARFIRNRERAPHTPHLRLCKSVPGQNMRIHPPRHRQLLVANQRASLCRDNRRLDALL